MAGVHALIMEDNRDSIAVLTQLLQQAGATATAYERPSDLDTSTLSSYDVVFLDLEMPGRNGYEVFHALRQNFGLTVPIVAYTANTNERSTAYQLGFNGMLSKPLNPQCFADQLRRILAGEPMWDDC